jgi:hypothetical protein
MKAIPTAAAACVLTALAVAYGLTFEPAPRVGIEWRPGISAERRSELERRFLLVNAAPDDDKLSYDLLDTSRTNIEGLVNERDVADTDRISRERFEVPLDAPYGTSWMWVAHRIPVLRIPGVVTVLVAASVVTLGGSAAVAVRRRRSRPRGRAARSTATDVSHSLRS